jgi:hypothetical protein
METAVTVLACSNIVTLILLAGMAHTWLRLKDDLASRKKELREMKLKQTEELTDFLSDFRNHGYSFVRVDPGSVFMRSPREL